MNKLKVKEDPSNPNIITISGSATRDLKLFLKQNYGAMYDTTNKEWLVSKDEQNYNIDERKLYGQLRAKLVDRSVQREFGKIASEEDSEENKLNHGKAILVYMEKINIPQINAAIDALHKARSEAKKFGENLSQRDEATLSYLGNMMLATKSLLSNNTLEMGDENNIAYFKKWQLREGLASELNGIRREKMFENRKSASAREDLDKEEIMMQR